MQISFVNLPFKTHQRLPIALGIKTKFLNKIELDLAPSSLQPHLTLSLAHLQRALQPTFPSVTYPCDALPAQFRSLEHTVLST